MSNNIDLNVVQLMVTLSGNNLTIPKKNLMSLNIDRNLGDAANKFTLEVFDETAYQMEMLLFQSTDKKIQISYTNSPNENSLITFSGFCYDYSTAFVGRGVMLSITGVVSIGNNQMAQMLPTTIQWVGDNESSDAELYEEAFGTEETFGKVCMKEKTQGSGIYLYNPSEIFKRICLLYGVNKQDIHAADSAWIEGLNTLQSAQTASDYIRETLAKNAVVLDKDNYANSKAGFKFYMNGTGYYFEPIDFANSSTSASFNVSYGQANSSVISFNITTSGSLAMASTLVPDETALDEITGDRITAGGENVEGSGYDAQKAEDANLTVRTFFSKYKGIGNVTSSSSSSGLQADAAARWNQLETYTIKASLTLWGNTGRDIAPGEYINVNVVGAEKVHWSSGTYYVIKSKDSVSQSGYTQQLTLLKNPGDLQSKMFVSQSPTADKSDNKGSGVNNISYSDFRQIESIVTGGKLGGKGYTGQESVLNKDYNRYQAEVNAYNKTMAKNKTKTPPFPTIGFSSGGGR